MLLFCSIIAINNTYTQYALNHKHTKTVLGLVVSYLWNILLTYKYNFQTQLQNKRITLLTLHRFILLFTVRRDSQILFDNFTTQSVFYKQLLVKQNKNKNRKIFVFVRPREALGN